jgi:predicted RNase H-like HicB family nuclease
MQLAKNGSKQRRQHMRALFKFELKVPVEVYEGSAAFIARCSIFDVASQGKTPTEAKKNLADALTLFITTCFEMGTLDEVMKDCGFKPRKAVTGKLCLKKDQQLLSVPLPFMVNNKRKTCHA